MPRNLLQTWYGRDGMAGRGHARAAGLIPKIDLPHGAKRLTSLMLEYTNTFGATKFTAQTLYDIYYTNDTKFTAHMLRKIHDTNATKFTAHMRWARRHGRAWPGADSGLTRILRKRFD